jgi:hypothetical protein
MAVVTKISDRKKKLPGVSLESFLTRTEAADLLGCTPPALITWERRGMLKRYDAVRADARGVIRQLILYDPKELGRLPRRVRHEGKDQGEMAARAFELFKLGLALTDVVVEVRELPERIAELHTHWLRMGGDAITVSDVAREHLIALVGEFKTVAELVERVKAQAGELAAARAQLRAAKPDPA